MTHTEVDYIIEKIAGRLNTYYHICGNRFKDEYLDEVKTLGYHLAWDERREETYAEWVDRMNKEKQ